MNPAHMPGYGDAASFPPHVRDPQRDDDAAEERREQAITDEINTIVAHAVDDPAELVRLTDRCSIVLAEQRVRVHGEDMTLERAQYELMRMVRCHDDADAIRAVEEDIRRVIAAALRSDPAVCGLAAHGVAAREW
jgi:hypothetical protein